MEYLRSLKKPAMEAGLEEGARKEVESAHTEEFNSVEEQEAVGGIQKSVDKTSEQNTCVPTSTGFVCEGFNGSSDRSNNEVVHIVTSGSPQPCRPKGSQENCSGDRFSQAGSRQALETSQPCSLPNRTQENCSGSRQALECRNLSCDCKTVTC